MSMMILGLTECQLGGPGKRVTTVTGRVINEAEEPVDSARVFMTSIGFIRGGIPIGDVTYTDADGNFELVVDVPKEYKRVSVGISFNHSLAFSNKYKDYTYNQRDMNTGSTCCPVKIGSKTTYDFTLIFR